MKKMCELKKEQIEANLNKILVRVKQPDHICKKCARSANTKEILCKPVRFES